MKPSLYKCAILMAFVLSTQSADIDTVVPVDQDST